MPTNLTGEAKAKWAEAQAERDPAKKVRLLKEFLSLMPKHKATERLERSIKRQIVLLEEELERIRSRKTGTTRVEWAVRKQGLPQLAIVGELNDALLLFRALTGLEVRPHDALSRPIVGPLKVKGLEFQLILAPLFEGLSEERRRRFINLAMGADGILIAMASPSGGYLSRVAGWFEEHGIDILSRSPKVELHRTPAGGIIVLGRPKGVSRQEVIELLNSYGIKSAQVILTEEASLDDLEDAILGRVRKPALIVGPDTLGLPGLSTDELGRVNAEALVEEVLNCLRLIRVYSKPLAAKPMEKPILLKRGSSVLDLARMIHSDLVMAFNYARLWRRGKPMKVGRHFVLEDGDIVEIHAS